MADIKCPHCGESFPLEKYLTSEHIKEIADVDIQKKVAEQVKLEKDEISKIYEKEKKELNKITADKIEELKDEMEKKSDAFEKEKKNYQKNLDKKHDAALEKKEAELEIETKNIKLANKKKLQEVEELKDKEIAAEKKSNQIVIDRLNQQIRDLGRKAGGDSELTGESFEETVKSTVQKEFVGLSVDDVAKGKKGADLVITTSKGAKILIEAKNTKNWSGKFISKLKDDISREGASHGIIVTNGVMPTEAGDKKYYDAGPQVSIVEFSNFIPALRIRVTMIDQITEAEWKMEGSKTKKDQLFAYVNSERFRNTVRTIMESVNEAQEQLVKEENDSQKLFDKRHMLLRKVNDNFYRAFEVEIQSYLLDTGSDTLLDSADSKENLDSSE